MADEMVRTAQEFINTTYSNVAEIPTLETNGKTGWPTMWALTRALQYELGITALSNTFGPTTQATLTTRFPSIDTTTTLLPNIARIIQAGLYCKGYDGGDLNSSAQFNGIYSARVATAIRKLKVDTGLDTVYPGDGLVPKLFKALLTMDAYVVLGGGTTTVRSIQQWMNRTYIKRTNFYVIPCDGYFSRDVQKALLFAIQFQVGMTDDAANGVFGPATQAGIKANPLAVGSSGAWVQLFSAAMVFNRTGAQFTSTFDSALAARVNEFQSFVKLPVNGKGDFPTWASLLVSTGDPTRAGAACDGITEVTVARAQTLKAAGYQVIGRYLCNAAGTSPKNKKIQPGELATIAAAGLRVFPIYQTFGGSTTYFNPVQGGNDALAAIDWARQHGFKGGTRIYFSVDFDALDGDVSSNIIPHFSAIKAMMDEVGSEYLIGIYGPRNICSRVAAAGLTTASFVCDMSTGFSGNLGFPMPEDWAFDQIATVTIGSGTAAIEIDNNILSGRDTGQNTFSAASVSGKQDVAFDSSKRAALLAELQRYLESTGTPEDSGGLADLFSQPNTTTEAFNKVFDRDDVFTAQARTLRIRKALSMAQVMWEYRKIDLKDAASELAVVTAHAGNLPRVPDDCSVGPGQIFARTAILSRNYLIGAGIITGQILDVNNADDVWTMWQRLRGDEVYNMRTTPYVMITKASDLKIPLPDLNYSDERTRLLMKAYQGSDATAEAGSVVRIGMYQIMEKYFAPLRNA